MKARVKAQDHINLDAVGIGTASIIARALRLLVEYEAGNEVTAGLGVTAAIEIEAAIEEAEAMKNGVAKELRKQRRDEKKVEQKSVRSEVPESLVEMHDRLDQQLEADLNKGAEFMVELDEKEADIQHAEEMVVGLDHCD